MLITLIVFWAMFVQTVAGFGGALVSMPLLVGVLGITTATPMVAAMAIVIEIILIVYYRHALEIKTVRNLALPSLIGLPVGVYFLTQIDANIVTTALGVLLVAYALYALFSPSLPELKHPGWSYIAGFLAGVLNGAYNTSGPPVIIYGTFRRWEPAVFKSNLQGFFFVLSMATLIVHLVVGNFTAEVWVSFLWTLPGIALGFLAGKAVEKRIDPIRFRQIVFVLLIVLGLRLLF